MLCCRLPTTPASAAQRWVQEMKVDAILRSGIRRFTDEASARRWAVDD